MSNNFSRRQLLATGAGALISAAVERPRVVIAGQQAGPATAAGSEELVFVNGRIHTMDRNNAIVNTVSIRNGRFSAVGGVTPRPASGRRIVDLKGRTAVPGIIDNHNHIVLMGNRPGYHTPLENASSIATVQEILAARAKGVPRGAWITTIGGFHRNQLAPAGQNPRLPTLAELDKAIPDNPVYLSEGFTGPSATNTLGKKFLESQTPPILVGD